MKPSLSWLQPRLSSYSSYFTAKFTSVKIWCTMKNSISLNWRAVTLYIHGCSVRLGSGSQVHHSGDIVTPQEDGLADTINGAVQASKGCISVPCEYYKVDWIEEVTYIRVLKWFPVSKRFSKSTRPSCVRPEPAEALIPLLSVETIRFNFPLW